MLKLQSITVMWSGFETQQFFLFLKTVFKKRDKLKDQSDYMIPFHAEVEARVSI